MEQGLWMCSRHMTEEVHLEVLVKDQKSSPESCHCYQECRKYRLSYDRLRTHLGRQEADGKRKRMRDDRPSFPLQKLMKGSQEHLNVYQLLQVLPQRFVFVLEFASLFSSRAGIPDRLIKQERAVRTLLIVFRFSPGQQHTDGAPVPVADAIEATESRCALIVPLVASSLHSL